MGSRKKNTSQNEPRFVAGLLVPICGALPGAREKTGPPGLRSGAERSEQKPAGAQVAAGAGRGRAAAAGGRRV